MAVKLIRTGCTADHPLSTLIRRINDLRSRDWEITFRVGYREANEAAHWLTASALNQMSGLRILDDPPEMLVTLVTGSDGLLLSFRPLGLFAV